MEVTRGSVHETELAMPNFGRSTSDEPSGKEMVVAALTAAGVASLSWWLGGVWPIAIILVAVCGAVASLRSSNPWVLSAGIGAGIGAMGAYWFFATNLIDRGSWVEWLNVDAILVGVALFGIAAIGGAIAYASDNPPPDVTPYQLAELVGKRIAPGMLVFGTVLTFMLGADAARPIVGNLGTGIASMAVVVGTGLVIGKRVGQFLRRSAGVQQRDHSA